MTTTTSTELDATALRQRLNEDPELRILDVRTGGEYDSAHIPGSFNVPLDTLGDYIIDLAAVDQPVVVVCQSGGRATKACEKLTGAGKETVQVLSGGLAAWQAAGGDVVGGTNPKWAMDRQVRLVAGGLILGAFAVGAVVPRARWLAAGVGGGLFFSAATNTCAMGNMLGRLPYNRTAGVDVADVVRDLGRDSAE